MAAGATAAAVLIGGDGRVASTDGDRRWMIEIAAPSGSSAVDRIEVGDGAVATSGCRRDHLIDPVTREFVRSDDVIQVSVLAGTGASAEALTKAVLIGGDRASPKRSIAKESECSRVGADGRLSANATWRRHRPARERAVGVNEQLWWYLARSAGMAAAALMVGALVLGVLAATRALKDIDRPAWLVALAPVVQRAHGDRRRDPSRRPRRRQLRALRTRRVARARYLVVAPGGRLVRGRSRSTCSPSSTSRHWR